MNLRTLGRLVRARQIPLLVGLSFLIGPFDRACFVSEAGRQGLLRLLEQDAKSFDEIAAFLEVAAEGRPLLRTWLEFGLKLGELRLDSRGYSLRGWWSRRLSKSGNDPALAALQEVVRMHHTALLTVPTMAKTGSRFGWSDYDVDILSRVGPVVEPFNREASELVIPRRGSFRLLDMGCGIGTNLRHAAQLNRCLTAVGLEMLPDVAAVARDNLQTWGLSDRVQIIHADVRTHAFGEEFDAVVAHGNFYFFPLAERRSLLEKIRSALKPGGKVMIATACRGGNLGFEVMNLWLSSSSFAGPLPEVDGVVKLMREAGFDSARAVGLLPAASYYAFVGTKPSSASRPS